MGRSLSHIVGWDGHFLMLLGGKGSRPLTVRSRWGSHVLILLGAGGKSFFSKLLGRRKDLFQIIVGKAESLFSRNCWEGGKFFFPYYCWEGNCWEGGQSFFS